MLAIEEEFGHKLSPDIWATITTVREMAEVIERDVGASPSKTEGFDDAGLPENYYRMIQTVMNAGRIKAMPNEPTIKIINPAGSSTPLIWVFNAPDREMTGLAGYLKEQQPLLGLYSGSDHLPDEDALETIGGHYAERIQALYPRGDFYLAGSCRGGMIAHRILDKLVARGLFPKRVLFLEYIDRALFNYPGQLLFIFGKQSAMMARYSATIIAARRHERHGTSMKVHWINGQHGQFFYPENIGGLSREVLAFLEGADPRVEATDLAQSTAAQ
jgi:hypothetical protein